MQPLELDATLAALDPMREYVTTAARAAGLTSGAAYRLALAVDEIATNIISYGHTSGALRLSARLDPARLEVVLEDQGQPYDPRQRPQPDPADLAADLADRPIGGLGIYLALNGVDGFDYHSEAGVNKNIFVMHRRAGP
jgi:serine/threonine-protein kinase RsbW